MTHRIGADLVVVIHLFFILFVILGGLLVLKWRRVGFVHVPAAIWGALIEFQGWLCPLTPLENRLRQAAGQDGYTTGFIDHYIVPVVYPSGLTRGHQILLGVVVLALNLGIYGWLVLSARRRSAQRR